MSAYEEMVDIIAKLPAKAFAKSGDLAALVSEIKLELAAKAWPNLAAQLRLFFSSSAGRASASAMSASIAALA
jgi:hypothetical protein